MIPAAARTLLDFIYKTETGHIGLKAYNTVFGHNEAKLKKPVVEMTFDQVVKGGRARTKAFGSSAIGAAQFMRDTLDDADTIADLKGEMGLSGRELFDGDLQDRLAYHLLKRRGWRGFVAGTLSVEKFGLALAKEWASFPVLKAVKGAHRKVQRGQTFYAGDGLNKSLVKPETVEAVLAKVKAMALAEADRPAPVPEPRPDVPAKPEQPKRKLRWSKRLWAWLTSGGAGGLYGAREMGLFSDFDWTFWAVLSGVVVALALISIATMPEVRQKLSRAIAALLP